MSMQENSIFTITPPDMQLLDTGPSVTIISTNENFIKDVESLHEQLFKTVPVNLYHPNGHITESNLAWALSVMRFSDTIFVDLDTATDFEILISNMLDADIVYINENMNRTDISKLFNSFRNSIMIYESVEDYKEIVIADISL
jgi:hypothetical protein